TTAAAPPARAAVSHRGRLAFAAVASGSPVGPPSSGWPAGPVSGAPAGPAAGAPVGPEESGTPAGPAAAPTAVAVPASSTLAPIVEAATAPANPVPIAAAPPARRDRSSDRVAAATAAPPAAAMAGVPSGAPTSAAAVVAAALGTSTTRSGGTPATRAASTSRLQRNRSQSSWTTPIAAGVSPSSVVLMRTTSSSTAARSASGPYGVVPTMIGSLLPSRSMNPLASCSGVRPLADTRSVPSGAAPTTAGTEPDASIRVGASTSGDLAQVTACASPARSMPRLYITAAFRGVERGRILARRGHTRVHVHIGSNAVGYETVSSKAPMYSVL